MLHVSKNTDGHLQYLLFTDGGVFALTLQDEKSNQALRRSRWVLNYRVRDEQDQDGSISSLSDCNVGKGDLSFPLGTASLFLHPCYWLMLCIIMAIFVLNWQLDTGLH
ncbi:MAG: hypothetical protein GX996_02930 [Firmicutes bacterium]|nr:hypothetical protein [Bacillota bacterium]